MYQYQHSLIEKLIWKKLKMNYT